jgi:hypothetical protein
MMANLYQYASFGVLETNCADGQTENTSLHAVTLCSECRHKINERSIKVKSIVLKAAYMKNAVLGYVTPCNLAQL